MKVFFRLKNRFPPNFSALIMASATSAASFRGQNVQASDQYGIRGLWSPSSVAEIGRCGDRSLEIFLASLDADPDAKGLPAYVQREFYDYLQCGILAHGFLLNVHFHCVFLEGVYLDRTEAGLKPRFVKGE